MENPELRIGKEPFLWRMWADNAIVNLDQLIEQGNIFSFINLKTKYGLPALAI